MVTVVLPNARQLKTLKLFCTVQNKKLLMLFFTVRVAKQLQLFCTVQNKKLLMLFFTVRVKK